jgi:hypothetical protein
MKAMFRCLGLGTVFAAGIAKAAPMTADAARMSGLAGDRQMFLAGHPMVAAVIHVLFLTLIIGMGAAVVGALFKPPFEN